jgi:hypothetical protein
MNGKQDGRGSFRLKLSKIKNRVDSFIKLDYLIFRKIIITFWSSYES